jgi:lipopolysaccharide transport system ATP-binding protein
MQTEDADNVVIRAHQLSKCYHIYNSPRDRLKQSVVPRLRGLLGRTPRQYYREFWALNDVSFEVKKGEAVGIIGRNGSGKSTLLQILAGTVSPTSGELNVNGRIAALLELGSGFNPEFTGRENVILNGQILGLTQQEITARYEQIVEFADIGEFIDQPLKTYSSGMFLRLAFAVQAHIDASIVIIDEALAVGDVFFRQKCYSRLEQLRNSGAAILLVSHSMPDIEQYCERAVLLDRGVARFIGRATEATKHYYLLFQGEDIKSLPEVGGSASGSGIAGHEGSNGRLPKEAFLNLSGKAQVGNGQARCTAVAMCNTSGEPCNTFRQGDVAVFYFEFELHDDIGVPICGMTISNDRGIIVHGKNSLQHPVNVAQCLGKGSRVVCRQEVKLDISVGEYVFQVGLAAMKPMDWARREQFSYEEETARVTRVCHVPGAGSFSIGFGLRQGVNFLSHHGIADLAGSISVDVAQ